MIDLERCKTDVAYRTLARECLIDSFELFVIHFFYWNYRKKFIFNSHHYAIIDYLNRIVSGEITFGIINMPPRYSKTELVIKLFISWTYAKNPACKYIHLSYDDPLAISNSEAILETIGSEPFQLIFRNVELKTGSSSRKLWRTNEDGEFYAIAAGKGITGHGAGDVHEIDSDGSFTFSGGIFIDDPLKPEDAHSDVKRGTVNRRWDETIKSRRNSSRTPVVVIMQRLHEDDFCGHLLSSDEFKWDVLCLPALSDNDKALWPWKHSTKELIAMRKQNSYVFSGQYQQNPTPKGGGIFKSSWWRFFAKEPPKFDFKFIVGDTAQKTKEKNDFSVFMCFGVYENRLYLLDMIRGKWESYELEIQACAFWDKWKPTKPRPRAMWIEDKVSGTGLIQRIKKKAHCPVKPIKRMTDKVTRAYDTAPYVESGYVLIPMTAPWLSDFLSELGAFTAAMTHKHDDICDVLFDGVDIGLSGRSKTKMWDVA